jgi:hypothetical protein
LERGVALLSIVIPSEESAVAAKCRSFATLRTTMPP